MAQWFVRRLLMIPGALLLINFLGFTYAILAQWLNTPASLLSVAPQRPALLTPYLAYLGAALRGGLGELPFARGTVLEAIAIAGSRTLGLLAIAFFLSLVVGFLLGLQAIQTTPPRASPWLIPVSTVALATPSFYIGMVAIAVMVLLILRGFPTAPLPFQGFGWDRHLILPVLALASRPTVQFAQVSSRLLSDELQKQYVVASRSLGYSWRRIRWRTALRNILAPLIITLAGAFRMLVGEIILVEWLFNWGASAASWPRRWSHSN
jgi:peptide/nickel transport system permease protein